MGLFGGNKTISIDFAADQIHIIEGKYSKKNLVINKFFSVDLPEDLYSNGEIQDLDQLSYLLKNALELNKISAADTYCVVNSPNVIIREVTMPKVTSEQITSILNYQLEDYLPISPQDYVVNFIVIGQAVLDGVEKLKILLVGIPKNIVEGHLNLLKNMDLKPAVLDYQGNAISKLIYMGDQINNYYSNENAITCLELGYENTSLTITKDGVILLNRVIELGYKNILENLKSRIGDISNSQLMDRIENIDLSDGHSQNADNSEIFIATMEVLNNLMDRIDMIFRYYKTVDLSNDINLLLLHGRMTNIKGIDKLFFNYFDIPSVKLEHLSKIKFNGELSKYANVIGGLIRRSEEKI